MNRHDIREIISAAVAFIAFLAVMFVAWIAAP